MILGLSLRAKDGTRSFQTASKKIERVSNTVLKLYLIFEGNYSDMDPNTRLKFRVTSSAIVDYKGRVLEAQVPITRDDNTAVKSISWGAIKAKTIKMIAD